MFCTNKHTRIIIFILDLVVYYFLQHVKSIYEPQKNYFQHLKQLRNLQM